MDPRRWLKAGEVIYSPQEGDMKLRCDNCKREYNPAFTTPVEPYANRHFCHISCRMEYIRRLHERDTAQLELPLETLSNDRLEREWLASGLGEIGLHDE